MKPRHFDRYRPHPWHGLSAGADPPRRVQAFIEITPFDGVKYEIDKETGYLRVDRPQHTSSRPPALYGFIPRTLCGSRVASLIDGTDEGDRDPLDICVFCEPLIERAEIVLDVRVIGGLGTIDGGRSDDKIIAVLVNDDIWGKAERLSDIPAPFIDRLHHYFSTYKMRPGEPSAVTITSTYDADHAGEVVRAAIEDYQNEYPEV